MRNTSWKNNLRHALLALTLCALPALAGPDNVGLGRGDDTPPTINTANQVINTYARVTAPLAPGDTAIQIGTPTGAADPIVAGDLLMVIQMTGIVPEPPSGDTAAITIDANQPVGRWEFARVSTVAGSTVNLTEPLLYSYAANVTQVVRVPEYANLTIPITRSLSPALWDGSTGGVLALLVTGTLTTNSGTPALNAAGRGFRSGQPATDSSGSAGCTGLDEPAPQGGQKGEGIASTRYGSSVTGRGHVTTGGGGGVCDNSGGGGGAHSGSGGQGGNSNDGSRAVGGTGGLGLTYVPSSQFNHLLMGGGGGAGHSSGGTVAGGRGGGIVFVRAGALSGIGLMSANGDPGGNASGQDGSSGGGGGGTVYVRVAGAATCGNITAIGGNGGSSNSGFDVGPGGAGGGGRVIFQKGSGTCVLPNFAVNTGNPGVQANSSSPLGASYGAQSGTAGTSVPLANGFAVLPAPVVNTPANGSSTNTVRPAYSGTISVTPALPAGTEIAVYVDGVLLGTTTADGGTGAWSFATPGASPALTEGAHTVYAVAINTAQGVQSVNSNTNTFTVDLTPPAVAVTAPADGSSTNDTTPLYSGTVEAGSTVVISVDGTVLGNATVTGGTWTFQPTTPLPEGSHTVTATATDVAGNTATDSNTFTVDTTPPAVAVTAPAEGSRTNNTLPVYTGTVSDAGPGPLTVSITVDGTVLGNATVTGGTWSFTPTTPLPEGSHTVTATATDAANNTATDSNTFTVDTTPPAVAVTAPVEGATTSDTTPLYAGTVSDDGPGPYTVVISVDGTVLGNATVSGGTWTFIPTTPLPEGSHTVTATATDVAGNTATDSNAFTVDTTPPAVAVTTPAEGSSTNNTTPAYTGTVTDNGPGPYTVTIAVDGTVLGNATVTGNTWTFTPTTPLPEGSHTVTASAADAAGNTAVDSNTFTVDTTAPSAPVVSTPANGSTIGDNTPAYSGTAEPGSSVTISVDGTVVGTTTADASGNWSFTPSTGLSNGSHTVNATAMDAAGNVSPVSNTNTFTVDATIPAAPVITGPANNTVTSDSTPTISGTAPANSTVTVFIDGTLVGTTTADASGNWTFTPSTPLADGPHDFSAVASNSAGNTSPSSNIVRITVDTGAPDTTIVSGPSGETSSPSATFEFSSPEAGVTYECKLDGAAEFTECPNPVTFNNLTPGQHTLEVRAKDPAGNVDPTPATATWTVVKEDLTGGDRDFLGDGIGCAASGGDPSALAMMGLGLLAVMMVRRRRQ